MAGALDVKHVLMNARLADEGSSALEALTSAWDHGATQGPDDEGYLQAFIQAAHDVQSVEEDLEHARANTDTAAEQLPTKFLADLPR